VSAHPEIRAQFGPIVASMIGLACGVATLGLPYSIGVFTKPLQAEFGWSITEIFLVQPIVTAAVVLMSFWLGRVVDRGGARRAIILSQLGFGLGLAAIGLFTESLLSFYVLYGLMALAAGGTLAITFMKLLTARFDRDRGLALGLALCGSGFTSFVIQPMYLAPIVQAYGWRAGYVAIGLLPIVLALPATLLWLRDAPAAVVATPASGARLPGMSLGAALRDYRFWALAGVFFLFSAAVTAVLNSFVPILMDKSYDAVTAARIAGTFGLAVIVGRVGIGWLLDRLWAPGVGCAFFLASALGMALLSLPAQSTPLTLLYVALAGLAAGAEVDLMAYLVSRYFGLLDFGKIYAGIYVGFALGPGLLVPAFGWAHDRYASYAPGLLGVAVTMLLSGLVLLTLGRYPPSLR
jgi:MFS family permease